MTQPQVSMLVCNDCGSVRVPVPAITSKIVTLTGQPPSVTPCPVCILRKQFNLIEEAATLAAAAEDAE